MAHVAGKDELIARIGTKVAATPRLAPDWISLSVVFTFEDGYPSNFGYYYTGDGRDDWSAFSSASDELDADVAALRDVMKAATGSAWHQGLFQLFRGRREMRFEFTYDGKTRWKVTPGNLHETVGELRPRF